MSSIQRDKSEASDVQSQYEPSKDDSKIEQKEVASLDADEQECYVILESKDHMQFKLSKKAAYLSELVKTIAEGDKENTIIPVSNVNGDILQWVVEFLRYHAGKPAFEIEKPLRSNKLSECGPKDTWYADFADKLEQKDQTVLFEVILAANYMDIKQLLDLLCAKIATNIKGQTPEHIREKFSIVNDFTPEEEEMVRAENLWAEG